MKTVYLSAAVCFVTCLGLWRHVQAHHCDVSFLVTSPKVLLAGTTETICINLVKRTAIEFTLSLQTEERYYRTDEPEDPEILVESNYAMDSDAECFDFVIPDIAGSQQYAKLFFQAKDMTHPDEGYVCNSNRSVLISGDMVETLIQTDKPIYKPGQPVKFRIMTVDKNFMPDAATIPLIWIESPNAIRLAQWKDVEPNRGLVDLEFPMTSEPLLGDWKIMVDYGDRMAEATFTVDEYVLPKFEVTIAGPPFILLDDETADVKICAIYTYGQPVHGNVSAEVTISSYYNTRPTVSFSGETGRDGCYSFEVDLTVFHLRSTVYSYWNSRLKVDATIIDAVTGEELQKSSDDSRVYSDALNLDINVPSSFKPGLPFYGTVSVSNPDGTPAGGKLIHLKADSSTSYSGYTTIYSENLTSPANGVIEFSIPDIDIETRYLSLLAEAPGYMSRDINHTQYWINNPYGISSLSAHYSPSGSFVQLEPIREKLTPGSTQNLNIYFTSNDPDAENTQFYFVFMSLGDVLDVPVSATVSRRRRQVEEEERSNGTPECEGDLVFNSCGSACPLICGEPESDICTLQCVAGCACPDNLYRDSRNGSRCMDAENCTSEDEPSSENDIIVDYVYPSIFIPEEETVNITEPGQLYHVQRSFDVTPDMSPVVSLLVYFITEDGEVVADSLTLDIEETFANEVNLEFSDEEVTPAGETSLEVTSDPNSLCAVGVVDKSVYVLGGENAISKNKLFESIRKFQLSKYGLFYDSSTKCYSSSWPWYWRRKRSVFYSRWRSSSFTDSSDAFKNIGLVYLSNMDVETRPCGSGSGIPFLGRAYLTDDIVNAPVAQENILLDDSDIVFKGEESGPDVRSYFPETFLWDLITVDDSGSAQIPLQAPHTITEWIGNGFCLSPENGLGVAPTATLRTFQPFFLTFSLPYSVIRGENVPIKTSVFNYLDACLVVRVTLEDSEDFELRSDSPSQDVCVCGGGAESVEFRIVPKMIGQMALQVSGVSVEDSDTLCGNEILSDQTGAQDAIRKDLLVKPEGVPKDYSFSEYFCLGDYPHQVYHRRASVHLPRNYVQDSAEGKIIVTGDMLGPSVKNLEHLIRLPTGCGEQNMLGFVPNIVALEYLTAVNQLEPELEERIKGNMRIGYQRELNYRHPDGSYSAFGGRDGSGNTWLTAFVVRSLAQSRKFIFIDEADLNVSISWLKGLQDEETGCIRSVGYLGYKAMMGGVSGESMLTAYVVVTYLEAGLSSEDEGVVKGLECVTADVDSVEDNYALSQIAYALALAGRTSELEQVMERLDDNANTESGLRFWTSNRPQSARSYSTPSADSISIEINSYMILTYFLQLSDADARTKSVGTVRWLIKNRGVQGGFGSTQDTVMGLTALGKFAASGDATTRLYVDSAYVRRKSGGRVHRRFYVTENNRQLQQEQQFDSVPRWIHFRSKGEGCALVQAIVTYTIVPTLHHRSSFTLKSASEQLASKRGSCFDYRLTIGVSYTGSDEESNMALVTVVPPSGFYPIKSSLEDLATSNPVVKRYEIDGETINFYFDSLDSNIVTFSFDVTKEFEVQNVKPGYITVTDYYEKSLTESAPLELECDPDIEPIATSEPFRPPSPPPPPPPPPPVVTEFETVGPVVIQDPDSGVVPEVRDPGVVPETDEEERPTPTIFETPAEVTTFRGFGPTQPHTEEEQETSKPREVSDSKPSPEDKLTPDDKGDISEEEEDKEEGFEVKPDKIEDVTGTITEITAIEIVTYEDVESEVTAPAAVVTDGVGEVIEVDGPEEVVDVALEATERMEEVEAVDVTAVEPLEEEEIEVEVTEVPAVEPVEEEEVTEVPAVELVEEEEVEVTEVPAVEPEEEVEVTEVPAVEPEEEVEVTEVAAVEPEEEVEVTEVAAVEPEEEEVVTEVAAVEPEEEEEVTEVPAVEPVGEEEVTEVPAVEPVEEEEVTPVELVEEVEVTEVPAMEPEEEVEVTEVPAMEPVEEVEVTEVPAMEPEEKVEVTEVPAMEPEEEEEITEVPTVEAIEKEEVTEVLVVEPVEEGEMEITKMPTVVAFKEEVKVTAIAGTVGADTDEEVEAMTQDTILMTDEEMVAEEESEDVTEKESMGLVTSIAEATDAIAEAGPSDVTMEPAQEVATEGIYKTMEITDALMELEVTTAIDECPIETNCSGPAYRCINVNGMYECQCAEGYRRDNDGNCIFDCPYCENELPDDGFKRFCAASFVYVVKRRKNDLRVLREKRFTNDVVGGRTYKNFKFDEARCSCSTLDFKGDRFILIAHDEEVLNINGTATVLPIELVSSVDQWRDDSDAC